MNHRRRQLSNLKIELRVVAGATSQSHPPTRGTRVTKIREILVVCRRVHPVLAVHQISGTKSPCAPRRHGRKILPMEECLETAAEEEEMPEADGAVHEHRHLPKRPYGQANSSVCCVTWDIARNWVLNHMFDDVPGCHQP